jgi:hypothetical protein
VTLEELEATVRQQITRVVTNALQSGVPSTGMMNRATEAILAAAGSYATHTAGITAERRAILAGTEPPVHYTEHPGSHVSVCGKVTRYSPAAMSMTTITGDVTCGSCKRTGNYAAALAGAR